MTESKMLEVLYHGRLVGKLAEMPDKRIAFQYDVNWLRTGFSISPFSLPLRGDVFVPTNASRECFGGLFGVFADSLPDSWGALLLDRYLKSIGMDSKTISSLDRLAYVGASGMGALEYVPSKEKLFRSDVSSLNYDVIAGECRKLLESKPSEQLDLLYKMGGSSGGTRPKILVSEAGREWILKFPARNDSDLSGRIEYLYSRCAKECGVVMTDTELVPSNVCGGYFKTARFDRENGNKIFTVTFAGILEADFRAPSCDYETFFKLIRVLTKDSFKDIEQLYRVMCFNILAHNPDDHAKNFSVMYTEDAGWHFAPAYDLTYSETYWGEHTTSIHRKGKDFLPEDVIRVGVGAGMNEAFCKNCYEEIFEKTRRLMKDIFDGDTGSLRKGDLQQYVKDYTDTTR